MIKQQYSARFAVIRLIGTLMRLDIETQKVMQVSEYSEWLRQLDVYTRRYLGDAYDDGGGKYDVDSR